MIPVGKNEIIVFFFCFVLFVCFFKCLFVGYFVAMMDPCKF